jgi:hypothetical protein
MAALAISVLPVPVGTVTSRLRPAKISSNARSCTGYGSRFFAKKNCS